MADWITRLAEEDKRRQDEEEKQVKDAGLIRTQSTQLVRALQQSVETNVHDANAALYGCERIFEVRRDIGLFDENRQNDFVVMTASYPAATMYVKIHPQNCVLTGTMSVKKDSASDFRDEVFIKVPVVVDESGSVQFKGMELDEVARIFVEPVVKAHTGLQPRRAPRVVKPQAQPSQPVLSRTAEQKKFSFVADSRIASILQRDYEELQRLDPDRHVKSVLVLSGGIIEGLLFDALVSNESYTFEQACNETLKNMIYPALKEKIIRQDKLTDVLRSYRNLIHPAREVKDALKFTVSDAKLAIHAVDIIIDEVREWHANKDQPSTEGEGN